MPSKTRGIRATKASKENIGESKTNTKAASKGLRGTRKPLTDKTNSASDDNATLEKPLVSRSSKQVRCKADQNVERPKRARRLPSRFKENSILKNLSNNSLSISKQESPEKSAPSRVITSPRSNKALAEPIVVSTTKINISALSPVKKINVSPILSPVKSLTKCLDNKLVKSRPKRICRLPNKLVDQSISPNKHTQVTPVHASTPLGFKTKKINKEKVKASTLGNCEPVDINVTPPSKVVKKDLKQKAKVKNTKDASADSNNNAKNANNIDKTESSSTKSPVKNVILKSTKNILNKNYSIRILDDKKKLKRDSSKLDVYEFTFDPEEEPPPTKKKKKRSAPKRPPRPKTVVKSSYDKNLAKALAALKKTVTKSANTEIVEQNKVTTAENIANNNSNQNPDSDEQHNIVNQKNYNSIRVEDIAFDMQPIVDDDNIDYSPVNSPKCPEAPNVPILNVRKSNDFDPLNLRDDISFFDDQPAASSSMNVSVRHPLASPWRTEFNNLPIKWQVNTYVKANMTPAFESSFINFNDSKKKHVYTNMVAQNNDSMPQIVDSGHNLKQTSIISFIKEVAEKNANKGKGKTTPVKANSLFEDIGNTSVHHLTTPKKTPLKENVSSNSTTSNTEISPNYNINGGRSNEKDDTRSGNEENIKNGSVTKGSNKTDKNNTYFGFDDSENLENISPVKKNRVRSLRSRTRGILQEINGQKGPTRAVIPVVAKSKPAQNIVDKVYEELKPATEPPIFEEAVVDKADVNVDSPLPDITENDDTQSVHLFEDIDLIHLYHHKPIRKSYSKGKKVTFRQKSVDNSDDSPVGDIDERVSSDEDNFDDLSFKLPSERPKKTIKKRKPKKQLTRKEEQEVEKWAAGFNSMCEDIDEFDLIVE